MARPQVTGAPNVEIIVADGEDIAPTFTYFRWTSFVNSGYVVQAEVQDPLFSIVKDFATKFYLEKGRSEPTPMRFRIKWDDDELKTEERLAFVTDMNMDGTQLTGNIRFDGIDPPSWWLNAGDGDGSVFKGKIGGTDGVIQQVINKYTKDIDSEISDTKDSKENLWYMYKQDPKTFIQSMLDWSCSLTNKKTSWIISSVDDKIVIKEQAELKGKDFEMITVNTSGSAAEDVISYDFHSNNMLSLYQSKIHTQGISAVSERFFDKGVTQDETVVRDENTGNKLSTKIGQDRGFKKPNRDWMTSVLAVPEFNAGDLGQTYGSYIDGRARKAFLDLINMVMRIKIRVTGDHRFDDSSILGTSTVTLNWIDTDGENYFLSGKWLIYGFDHFVTRQMWYTDLYLARLDFDATFKEPQTG